MPTWLAWIIGVPLLLVFGAIGIFILGYTLVFTLALAKGLSTIVSELISDIENKLFR